MDATTLIITALEAGVATGGQAITTDLIKDAYTGLKTLIQHKFEHKPKAQETLKDFEEDPDVYKKPLKKFLIEEQTDQDANIIHAAEHVLSLIQSQQAAISKYNVQITGNVQGFAEGDYQNVTMNFGEDSER